MVARFRDISSVTDARDYYEGLSERWPERIAIIDHLCEQVAALSDEATMVELCAGGGQLAWPLLTRFPRLRYIGLDLSPHGLAYAEDKLASFGGRVTLRQADLNTDDWLAYVPPQVDGWLSLQSLHDLGDANAVARIYAVTRKYLRRGGRWILADLLPQTGQDPAVNPGRLPIETHLQYFEAAGYATAQCTMQTDHFGCFVAEAH
jgi:cyclopropane fatty-acyl-phospholipid synthase-like methyltransferase